jgi:hypothetical protein
MAAAAPTFSALYGDPTKWENAAADYPTLTAAFGHSATSVTAPNCRDGLVQLSNRTPVVLAFVSTAEPDYIYVAHSLTLFPADITDPTAMDGLAVGIVGDLPASCVPVVFTADFFTVIVATRAHNIATLQGPAGHGAIPPVFRTGPHGAAAADTDELRTRRAMVMPPTVASVALANAPTDGRYSLLGFFNTFLQAPLASADAAVVATIAPLAEWWRLACTDRTAGGTAVSHDLLAVTTPRSQARLSAWAARVKESQLARIGVGGPGLSNAAFAHGVAELKTTMENTHIATLEFERARNEKTFTDQHGAALALQMHRLCGVTSDADLPEVHNLLLKTAKGRVYGVLTSLFAQRTQASPVPLIVSSAPLATTKLVDDVFRTYMPGNDGMTFGKGLSPFAIVCEGHDGIALVQKQIQQAQLLEAGTSLSLADASALTAGDVRFPTLPFVAVEKLYGWSIVVDVFHGVNHALSINLRNAVTQIGPLLMRIGGQMGDTPSVAMELICRVMFDMQQDYFAYLAQLSTGVAAVVPDFLQLTRQVSSHRAGSLSSLPDHWYAIPDCPKGRSHEVAPKTGANTTAMRPASTGGQVVNAHADRRLMTRYKDSGHLSITAMVGGRQLEYPKHANKPVCMAWALKGTCASNCKRAAQHVRYGAETVKALHKFMDECGVANPQP